MRGNDSQSSVGQGKRKIAVEFATYGPNRETKASQQHPEPVEVKPAINFGGEEMSCLLHGHCHILQRLTPSLCSSSSPSCASSSLFSSRRNSHGKFLKCNPHYAKTSFRVSFALTEPDSSSESLGSSPQFLLQELADSFDLPLDYFAKLPRDLRLDLNDAAFDISNGPVIDQCGPDLGKTLLNLSRAWEQGDTSTSCALAKKLPLLESSLTNNEKSAFGKRLLSAGRRFQSMGQYGQGELQKIAKSMISAGKRLSAISGSGADVDMRPKTETRMFKFGELQVELTPQKAYFGAAIALVFGIVSWQVSQGVQSIPESSLEYANDNALLLAKSLRGALLIMSYSSTILSTVSSVALLLLGRQLDSKEQ